MGLDASLLRHDGEEFQFVGDPSGAFLQSLMEADRSETVCLRFIDLFGRTSFNRGQCVALRRELEALRSASSRSAGAHIDRILRLVDLVERGKASELRFEGD